MPIKAIETRYRGYRFRSRLEARWAVFFDNLKIKWDYEPEGFELEKGLYYLPDFLLYGNDGEYLWVEVKPFDPTSVDKLKMQLLCDGDDRRPNGCIVHGTPGLTKPIHYNRQSIVRHTRDYDHMSPTWALAVSFADFSPRQDELHGMIGDAVDAACGARFEHGESGAA